MRTLFFSFFARCRFCFWIAAFVLWFVWGFASVSFASDISGNYAFSNIVVGYYGISDGDDASIYVSVRSEQSMVWMGDGFAMNSGDSKHWSYDVWVTGVVGDSEPAVTTIENSTFNLGENKFHSTLSVEHFSYGSYGDNYLAANVAMSKSSITSVSADYDEELLYGEAMPANDTIGSIRPADLDPIFDSTIDTEPMAYTVSVHFEGAFGDSGVDQIVSPEPAGFVGIASIFLMILLCSRHFVRSFLFLTRLLGK